MALKDLTLMAHTSKGYHPPSDGLFSPQLMDSEMLHRM